jgi:hypothetical protein
MDKIGKEHLKKCGKNAVLRLKDRIYEAFGPLSQSTNSWVFHDMRCNRRFKPEYPISTRSKALNYHLNSR